MARRLALGLLLLPLLLAAPAAGDDTYQRKQAVEDRIQALHDRIAGARAQEGVLTSRISTLNGQIRTLEGQVPSATDRLTVLERDLALHRQKLERLTELYRLESRRLVFLRAQYREAERRPDQRPLAIYESDNPHTGAGPFAATSLSHLVEQLHYPNKIRSHDPRPGGEGAP